MIEIAGVRFLFTLVVHACRLLIAFDIMSIVLILGYCIIVLSPSFYYLFLIISVANLNMIQKSVAT